MTVAKEQFEALARLESSGAWRTAILSLQNNSSVSIKTATLDYHLVTKQGEIRSRRQSEASRIAPGEKAQVLNCIIAEHQLVFDKLVLSLEDGSEFELDAPPGVLRSGCFVATALYGDDRHPDLGALRAFRDNVLARRALGRRFIAWYIRRGPDLAAYLMRHKALHSAARIVLLPVLRRAAAAMRGRA